MTDCFDFIRKVTRLIDVFLGYILVPITALLSTGVLQRWKFQLLARTNEEISGELTIETMYEILPPGASPAKWKRNFMGVEKFLEPSEKRTASPTKRFTILSTANGGPRINRGKNLEANAVLISESSRMTLSPNPSGENLPMLPESSLKADVSPKEKEHHFSFRGLFSRHSKKPSDASSIQSSASRSLHVINGHCFTPSLVSSKRCAVCSEHSIGRTSYECSGIDRLTRLSLRANLLICFSVWLLLPQEVRRRFAVL